MGVSIWGAVHLHSGTGERWVERVSRLHGTTCWRQCGSNATKLSGLDTCEDGRLSAGVERRYPVTVHKASLMARSVRRVLALWHQTGAQYSAVEWTRARVAIHSVAVPAPEPASPRKDCDAWCQLFAKWLEVSTIRERPVQRYSEVFGFGAEGQGFVVEMEDCRHRFCSAELWRPGPEVFIYGWHVLSQHPFHYLPVSISMHDC